MKISFTTIARRQNGVMSTAWWICPYKGTQHLSTDTGWDRTETWEHYAKWKLSVTKGQMSPNSQNPRKTEERMVIARGCGGRDWRELLHRDSIEGEEKFWQWMVGNDCAKCRWAWYHWTIYFNCYDGRCFNMCQWQMFHYVHFITLTITT